MTPCSHGPKNIIHACFDCMEDERNYYEGRIRTLKKKIKFKSAFIKKLRAEEFTSPD